MVERISFGGNFTADFDFEDSAWARLRSIFSAGGRVGVACSGGADSVFLLHCVACLFSEKAENVFVLHFNHKVRAAAKLDERHVESECARLGLSFVRGQPERLPEKISESSLRKLRLGFFAESSRRLGLEAIAQGHHCGDALESLLMRISRGAGLDGLCSPRAVSRIAGTEFLRPLLRLKKSQITSALSAARIAWREDESNAGTDYFRNRIRNIVLPELRRAVPTDLDACVLRTRKLLFEDACALSEIFDAEFSRENGAWGDRSRAVLSPLLRSHAAFARRAVEKFAAANGLSFRSGGTDEAVVKILRGADFSLRAGAGFLDFDAERSALTVRFERRIDSFECVLSLGENILPDSSRICVRRVVLDSAALESLAGNDDSKRAYLDISAFGVNGCSLVARTRRVGDMYAPVGCGGAKKIGELFCAKKTPVSKRKFLPVVCNNAGEILWIPTLAPARKYKIGGTGEALELTFSSDGY